MKWLVGGVLQDESLFSTTHSLSARRTRSILTLESVQKQDSKVQCQVTFADVTVQSDEANPVCMPITAAGIQMLSELSHNIVAFAPEKAEAASEQELVTIAKKTVLNYR